LERVRVGLRRERKWVVEEGGKPRRVEAVEAELEEESESEEGSDKERGGRRKRNR